MTKTVVVGAGLAGLRAAQRVRERTPESEIVIVGDEKHRPYNRPPVSKELLGSTMTAAECVFEDATDDFTWLLDNAATGLNPQSKVVQLAQDDLHYDNLVIATGRGAYLPSAFAGLEGVHVLRGLDDAAAFSAAAASAKRVVIIGGGFIGCEVAAVLAVAGTVSVTVVEMAKTLMPVLGPTIGSFAGEVHSAHGVNLRCGTGVIELRGDTRVEQVVLTSGEVLDADLVLVAIGSRPNTSWLSDSGLPLAQGSVVCDEFCFVKGYRDIVAVGDVATWDHHGVGRQVRVEHWSNAAEMGLHAAENLTAAHHPVAYMPIPTFWTDQYDLHIKAAGFVASAERFEPTANRGPTKWSWDGIAGARWLLGSR
ncbi:NAD(P)/FAD-dependent oxidoreductase [Gordonia rubripertincta]|uniref:NAD(P)/FAD-dependent oxidoreductase n=1 Tax=Gordonia rubripertincta TaxID=36822 RepID=UPI0039B5BBD4